MKRSAVALVAAGAVALTNVAAPTVAAATGFTACFQHVGLGAATRMPANLWYYDFNNLRWTNFFRMTTDNITGCVTLPAGAYADDFYLTASVAQYLGGATFQGWGANHGIYTFPRQGVFVTLPTIPVYRSGTQWGYSQRTYALDAEGPQMTAMQSPVEGPEVEESTFVVGGPNALTLTKRVDGNVEATFTNNTSETVYCYGLILNEPTYGQVRAALEQNDRPPVTTPSDVAMFGIGTPETELVSGFQKYVSAPGETKRWQVLSGNVAGGASGGAVFCGSEDEVLSKNFTVTFADATGGASSGSLSSVGSLGS